MAPEETKDDTWIPTSCYMCFSSCGTLAHRVDGVIVKIEGQPDCPHNWGKLCPKGHAAIMNLYDPYRVKKPLKRTNPEKGLGVDPKWVEISWGEALDTAAQRLKKIREDDPRKLILASWDVVVLHGLGRAWASAFGTPNSHWSGYFCGNALHPTMYLTNGSFHSEADLEYCNYLILFGNQMGFMGGINPNIMAQKMADARMRGMKVVVVDPVGTNAAAKADEWLPIRPGTDAALSLAMVNLLLNEYHLYDAAFVQKRTNGPYLVGPQGRYLREAGTGKPLIWDIATKRALPFDAPIEAPALEGEYDVDGVLARPAFQCLREHVRKYNPEMAAEITTLPVETIRRLAQEYGEAARIGATIVIQGRELPYRPAAANQYRGAYAHRHGFLTALSIQLLNLLIGNPYVPGGHRGVNLVGPNLSWMPQETDGLIVPPNTIGHGANPYNIHVAPPQTTELTELMPQAYNKSSMNQMTVLDPEAFKLPYRPEAMLHCRTNIMMSRVNPEISAQTLKNIPFIISFARELNEVAEFADIVFPDTDNLERLDLLPNQTYLAMSPITGYWYWGLRQPVVPPAGEARDWTEVLLELAERIGFLDELYEVLNITLHLSPPHRLDPTQKYSPEEINDHWAKSMFGEEHGLEWFRQAGYLKEKRQVEEIYPGPLLKPRFPIYFEQLISAGEQVRTVTEELGLPWDTSDYQPIPDWKPCPAYEERGSERDLYAVNYKVPFHYQSFTSENPWLNELSEQHPYAYKIMINTETAKRKGIQDGELIAVESAAGRAQGRAKVTECIHPEVVAMAGVLGSWARGKPIARGKGPHFNSLLSLDKERVDWVSAAVDACVRVKVYRIEE
ncbi:MAG: molybdopterin-dependent oxidoreductase [Chloroflexi bacterium]|nr:molybdopterin-dependent oxidoreductase [Chloroflexota bacterium]